MDEKEAQKVLQAFYNNREPEPINSQDLLDAGKPIVPYLLVEILKRDMPKREYAILALGKIRDERAIPLLIRILEDRTELLGPRKVALRAIWQIKRPLGEEYATKYSGENNSLDATIQLLREGKL